MAEKRNLTETQELNSILAESRSRANAPAPEPKTEVSPAPAVKPRVRVPAASYRESGYEPASARTRVAEDYVAIGEDGTISSPKAKKDRAPKKKKKSRVGLVVGVILGVLLIAAAGGVTWYLNSGSSVMAKNISVSGVSLADMTVAEAKTALKPVEDKLADEIMITITHDDKSVKLTKEDIGHSFNTDEILKDAASYSAEKGLKQGEQTYEIKMTVDDAWCHDAAERVAKEFNARSTDAYVTDYDSSGKGTFTIQDEVTGLSVRTDELETELKNMVTAGKYTAELEAPADVVKPKYTKKFLSENITEVSSFSTISTNNANANSNMNLAMEACDGSIIDPGEIWSFNESTGDSTLESRGYLPAGIINQGRNDIGIGGGICQACSTIYNATVLCGMDVVERSCHYYRSSYVDPGRDATVDYGNLDLKMQNTFDTQLFMKCYMDGTELTCIIYGIPQSTFDKVEFTSEVVSYFSNGYSAEAYRTYYKDGKAIQTEEMPYSTYYTSAPKTNDDDDDDDDDDDSSASSASSSGSSSASSSGAVSSAAEDDPPVSEEPADTPAEEDNTPEDEGGNDNADEGGEETPADNGGGEDTPVEETPEE